MSFFGKSLGELAKRPTRYRVNDDGTISTLTPGQFGLNNNAIGRYDAAASNFPYGDLLSAQNAQAAKQQANLKELQNTYEKRLADVTSQENAKTAAASQIANLAGTGLQNNLQAANMQFAGGTPNFNEKTGTYNAVAGGIQQLAGGRTDPALLALSAERNYGASPIAAKLNFQVSDDQILNDYNTAKVDRYKRVVELGNTQAVGIQERLTAAQKLLDTLPANSAQRTASDVYVDGLKKDLASVRSAVSDATSQIGSFKPLAVGSTEAAKEITSFRSFLQLPEERATQQLRQIDPDSYDTSVELGKRYRDLATQDIGPTQSAETEAFRAQLEKGYRDYSASAVGATTTPETEALRKRIEDEATSQLALGSQLGAEEQRQYQQAARGAQSARGNIFGIGPAVEEAVTTGLAGEQRLQARLGAAQGFLSSGQSMTDAAARDVGLRNALTQSRLGAAQGFIASGPTMYNLASQRLGTQQGLLNNYLAASQPQATGGFQATPSAANPYAYVNPNAGFQGAQNAASIYNTLADYQAKTYGAYTGAVASQPSGAQQFGAIASGIGSLIPSFSFSK